MAEESLPRAGSGPLGGILSGTDRVAVHAVSRELQLVSGDAEAIGVRPDVGELGVTELSRDVGYGSTGETPGMVVRIGRIPAPRAIESIVSRLR